MSEPWTEAHKREALRRTYEIAAELVAAGHAGLAWLLAPPQPTDDVAPSAQFWADHLGSVGIDGRPVLDPARIDREVRRVRALAEGRLVRATVERWRVYHGDGRLLAETDEGAAKPDKVEWVRHLSAPDCGGDGRCAVIRVRVARLRRAR